MKYLAAFLLLFTLDWLYAVYTLLATERRAAAAGVTAGVLYAVSGVVTWLVVNDLYVLPAAVAGAVAGTYAAIKWPLWGLSGRTPS